MPDRLWPALWTHLDVPGVETTDHVSERAFRPAVLWRDGSFGTQSGSGARFAGAMLTVAATCRMHGLDPFASLAGVCTASKAGHFGLAVPQLLPVTALPQAAPDVAGPITGWAFPADPRERSRPSRVLELGKEPWGNQALRSLHPHLHPAVVAIWRANPPSTPILDVLAHPGSKNPGS